MAASNFSYLNGPVPGMSLTSEPGNRPWENPPELVTIEEAIEYYADKILRADPIVMDNVLDILEAGIPIRNMANILQTTSVMQGRHTLDVGFLVAPVIEEMLMSVCDINNVKFIRAEEDLIRGNYVTRRQSRKAVQEALQELEEQGTISTPDLEQPAASKGLMARPEATQEQPVPMTDETGV